VHAGAPPRPAHSIAKETSMASSNNGLPGRTLKVTLEVPEEHLPALEQLLSDFNAGRVRAAAPAFDFTVRDYREAAQMLVHDPETSYALRARILEDDKRDPASTLADAEAMHALQAKRFAEAGSPASVVDGREGLEQTGIEALRRLFTIAKGHAGQCGRIARFLLGLYNGYRFPFDLTLLRDVDDAIFEDCLRLLRMDAMLVGREVHEYLANGSTEFENLAEAWRMQDVGLLRHKAKRLAEDVSFSGLHARAATELVGYIDNHH
jgi:hypothetical protein